PARLPAIAHIHPAARRQQVLGRAVVAVVAGNRAPTITEGAQIHQLVLLLVRPVAMHLAIDPEPRHPAIGIDVQPHMGPDPMIGDGAEVMGIAAEIGGRQDLGPARPGIGIVLAAASFEGGGWRVVAGEMAGIDVDALDHAGPTETNGAVVMAGPAPAPAFP